MRLTGNRDVTNLALALPSLSRSATACSIRGSAGRRRDGAQADSDYDRTRKLKIWGVPSWWIGRPDGFIFKRTAPSRDARKAVAEARTLARDTHRRVWIVDQDARDSSSVRLSHWLDDQRPLLDRDFVIVKLLGGRDQHISDVCKDLDLGESPTWFAIIDGAGTMLANSEQAENSFNYPRSADEKRQFRGVLQKTVRTLTPTDVDRLMNSLGN